jgi:L-ascorbate metabolism protein UlaG (beta-lactamase superfamily)
MDHPRLDATARAVGARRERTLASPQFRDGVFHNLMAPAMATPSLRVVGEFFFGRGQRTPPAPLPIDRPHATWNTSAATGLRATWLGHSTVLLELDGRRVLTDPVFGMRASPVGFAGPKRFHPVPVPLADLPPLDAVLISHDHFDHLCRKTVVALATTGVPFVTALGVGAHLEKFGIAPAQITELDWHERATVGGIDFTATPSQHFSGRSAITRDRTLWASWVLQSARHKVFFSGDTGLTPQFADIARAHGRFDLVMLEIGAYHPAWGTIHLGPANALTAFDMLGGGTLLPVHWGTFNLAMHDWNQPAEAIVALAAARGARVLTPRLGQAFEPDHLDGPTPWWRGVGVHLPATPSTPLVDQRA